jgi:hypothetical protein
VHVYDDEERARFADRAFAYDFYKTAWKAGKSLISIFRQGTPECEAATAHGRAYLEKNIKDPELRKLLTPNCES